MPHDLLSCHGVPSLVVAAGTGGRILMFGGDLYAPIEVASPTRATLRGVWVESPTSAWAVGDAGTVLRWDGLEWCPVPLAARHEHLTCIWGHPHDGVWIGGRRSLMHLSADGEGETLIQSDVAIRSIWGTGPSDVWFLSSGQAVVRWTGQCVAGESMPGDDGEEWNCVTGSAPDAPVYVVGPMGLVMEWTGETWMEFVTETAGLLTSACCDGPDLYVTTDRGLVRHYDSIGWRTVAFSAFGALNACCVVDGVLWACGDRGVVLQHRPEEGGE